MKVFIIIPRNPHFESTASANRWRGLIEGLVAIEDVDVELLITGGYSTLEEKALGSRGTHLNYKYRYFGKLQYNTLWQRRFNNYIWRPFFKRFIQSRTLNYLAKKQEGIVWTAPDLEGLEVIVSLKNRKAKIKTFIEMSEFLDINQSEENTLRRKHGDKRKDFFENTALYAFDGIALMTNTLINHYKSFSGNLPKIMHLPMTVDLKRFENVDSTSLSDQLSKPYMAFIGVMSNKKDGVDILIDSFATIKKDYPDLSLYLFGPYHYDTPGHLAQIKELGLSDSVFYKGEVDRTIIPSILKEAQLVVLPRPDSKQAQGGFPTKLGEYLASGTPVCATSVGELPLYLTDEENVYFAQPGSVESFTDALQRALKDPQKALEVGQNGRKAAEVHFNKDIQGQTLYNFLKQL